MIVLDGRVVLEGCNVDVYVVWDFLMIVIIVGGVRQLIDGIDFSNNCFYYSVILEFGENRVFFIVLVEEIGVVG